MIASNDSSRCNRWESGRVCATVGCTVRFRVGESLRLVLVMELKGTLCVPRVGYRSDLHSAVSDRDPGWLRAGHFVSITLTGHSSDRTAGLACLHVFTFVVAELYETMWKCLPRTAMAAKVMGTCVHDHTGTAVYIISHLRPPLLWPCLAIDQDLIPCLSVPAAHKWYVS